MAKRFIVPDGGALLCSPIRSIWQEAAVEPLVDAKKRKVARSQGQPRERRSGRPLKRQVSANAST